MSRVVVTGIGIVAPNGVGKAGFLHALQHTLSGLRHDTELARLGFGCQVSGIPPVTPEQLTAYFDELTIRVLKSTGIQYGCMAGMDAWNDAGLTVSSPQEGPNWDAGCIFGTGLSGVEPLRDAIYLVDQGQVRRLGSRVVEQTMTSGISAYLGGKLGLGNWVTTNSSACSTGSESFLMAYERIQAGKAKIMLAGSCDSYGPYIWGGFDSMRVMNRKMNDTPEKASRPMSETADGFIPGAGAGALVLESLESAQQRGVHIYAEVLGGFSNSGGQRNDGSMTAPNSEGVKRCIKQALENAGVDMTEVDAICGHLTSTMGDVLEISNWAGVLGRSGKDFPYVNSLKTLTGHCLGAAGSVELVASVLQLENGFLHGNPNSGDLHPEIALQVDREKIPLQTIPFTGQIIAKSSFGFGDVNTVVVLKKWKG